MAWGSVHHYAGVKVAVCAKQVPDAHGVEMALQLVASAGGGEVVLVSMAPDDETLGLRTGLAMGADRAVLVSDDRLAGSDALGTAKVLASAVARLGADLVLAATEPTDGCTGALPGQLAELLGLPSVTFAERVEIVDGRLRIERQTGSGFDEVQCPLPAVVSVTTRAVRPRIPSFRGIMAARGKPIEQLSIADLGLDPSVVGHAGSRQRVTPVASAEERAPGNLVEDDGHAHHRIIELLERLNLV